MSCSHTFTEGASLLLHLALVRRQSLSPCLSFPTFFFYLNSYRRIRILRRTFLFSLFVCSLYGERKNKKLNSFRWMLHCHPLTLYLSTGVSLLVFLWGCRWFPGYLSWDGGVLWLLPWRRTVSLAVCLRHNIQMLCQMQLVHKRRIRQDQDTEVRHPDPRLTGHTGRHVGLTLEAKG